MTMKTFKAFVSGIVDTTPKHEIDDGSQTKLIEGLKSARFTMKSFGPFPDIDKLVGRTVEIRILD